MCMPLKSHRGVKSPQSLPTYARLRRQLCVLKKSLFADIRRNTMKKIKTLCCAKPFLSLISAMSLAASMVCVAVPAHADHDNDDQDHHSGDSRDHDHDGD